MYTMENTNMYIYYTNMYFFTVLQITLLIFTKYM